MWLTSLRIISLQRESVDCSCLWLWLHLWGQSFWHQSLWPVLVLALGPHSQRNCGKLSELLRTTYLPSTFKKKRDSTTFSVDVPSVWLSSKPVCDDPLHPSLLLALSGRLHLLAWGSCACALSTSSELSCFLPLRKLHTPYSPIYTNDCTNHTRWLV